MKTSFGDRDCRKHGYIFYTVLVIMLWGFVPTFAKLGSLSGSLTTMYANWFAVGGILIIMVLNRSIRELTRKQPYFKIASWGIIWPLIYSIAYFSAIDLGSPYLTIIFNYTWPVFYLVLASVFLFRRFSLKSWLTVLLAVVAVTISVAAEQQVNIALVSGLLGLLAAFTQALYSILTEDSLLNAWLVTLVVSAVTAVGSTVYVFLSGAWYMLSNPKILFYLAFIGILSNGIGFWAFLRANQTSAEQSKEAKTIFLVMMCFTPLIQVILLPLLQVEEVSYSRWGGVLLITLALVGYRISESAKSDD